MPDIYQYIDYRAFLGDYYKEQKAANRGFSYMYFSHKANIKSSGFILHLIKRERNVTRPVLLNIARAIGLDPAQTEYFEDLMAFDQAKTQSDREFYFSRISAKRKLVKAKPLEDRQHELYSAWYHPVIREIVNLIDDAGDCAALSKLLIPPITPMQAKKSLNLQKEIGVLTTGENGAYRQAEPFITGGGPVRNTALVKYQKEMLEQTKGAWDHFSSQEITMHTVTLCMSEDLLDAVREEVRAFKNRLLELVASEQKEPERVYHLNINLFPVTKSTKGNKR